MMQRVDRLMRQHGALFFRGPEMAGVAHVDRLLLRLCRADPVQRWLRRVIDECYLVEEWHFGDFPPDWRQCEAFAKTFARGAAILGIFHDEGARARLCDRLVDVTAFTPRVAA